MAGLDELAESGDGHSGEALEVDEAARGLVRIT
jgi:hypothetical protein